MGGSTKQVQQGDKLSFLGRNIPYSFTGALQQHQSLKRAICMQVQLEVCCYHYPRQSRFNE